MQRILDNFQEVGWKADNGCYVRTDLPVRLNVSVIAKHRTPDEPAREYIAHMTFTSLVNDETIAISDRSFPTLDGILDLLGIDDIDEVWEVLET